jgi:hypothetical protein
MVDQDRTGTEPAHGKVVKAVPVTPSEETERPDGLAFDVEKGAELPGVPVGDQAPKNPELAIHSRWYGRVAQASGWPFPATRTGTQKSPSTTRPANADFPDLHGRSDSAGPSAERRAPQPGFSRTTLRRRNGDPQGATALGSRSPGSAHH